MRDELLSNDPVSGIRRTLKWDESEEKLVVHNFQECGDILEFNRALYNAERSTSSLWGGRSYVRVASIPNILIEKWRKEGLDFLGNREDRAKIMAMLSSNEYSLLRTAPGRLI